jgi:hypothetical protein
VRAATFALWVAACANDSTSWDTLDRDPSVFVAEVYPVLLGDCGFPACHGDPARPLWIVGPGRTRLRPETPPFAPATAEELATTYTRTVSMLAGPDAPSQSWLLRKPLAVRAGGASHAGDDDFGRPIYASKDDPRWQALFFWVTAGDAP